MERALPGRHLCQLLTRVRRRIITLAAGLGLLGLGCKGELVPCAPCPACTELDRPDAENLKAPATAIVPRDLEKIFGTPTLAAEMMGSPFVYFRKINTETIPLTCKAFEDALRWFPPFDLHGDAHLEQFAVSAEHHGLSDYDDVATGPGVIDLVRFGVSVRIAARMKGWDDQVPGLIEDFIDRYTETLAADVPPDAPAPSVVPRIRQDIAADRHSWLAWVSSVTSEVSDDVRAELEPGSTAYRKLMQRRHPDLPSTFFDTKEIGHLKLGVGSRLHPKFLFRVEGPSPDPDDDVIIEFKPVTRATNNGCVSYGGATSIVRTVRLFANEPVRFIAQVPYVSGEPLDDMPYWAREWLESYAELRVDELKDIDELRQVVLDVAIELATVHPRLHGKDTQARREQVALCGMLRPRIISTIDDIAARTWQGWDAFAAEAKRRGMSPKAPKK